MTACFVEEQRMAGKEMEKQMGCMAGFLNLFDRHQILAGKRLYPTKRLAPAVDSSSSSSGVSVASPPVTPVTPVTPVKAEAPVAVEIMKSGPLESPKPNSSPLPLPIFEEGLKSSWKFREAPRLSLDSRVSGKGGGIVPNANASSVFSAGRSTEETTEGQRRAPSVIARLMGLEALPDSGLESSKKIELRRSASESRVSRDLLQAQYRFVLDGGAGGFHPAKQALPVVPENPKPRAEERAAAELSRKPKYDTSLKSGTNWAWSSPQHRKSFFDSQDVFPELVKRTGSLYGEIEKRFKMRGIDERANDLETLKQILEALQLKGLLHSKRPNAQFERRNFILDRQLDEAPIVVMKPSRSPKNQMGKRGYASPPLPSSPSNSKSRGGVRRTEAAPPPARPMKRENQSSSNGRGRYSGNESPVKSPKRLSINVNADTQRKVRNNSDEQRRISSPKKIGPDLAVTRSPRNRKSQLERISAADEESSSLSESNASAYSQIDAESQRSKMEDYREGRSLLERCDKLLHSIAEITANDQPSPVSVLDSSFYKDEGSPPPMSMKRCLDFKDEWAEMECEEWSPVSAVSPIRTKLEEQSEDQDFLYVCEILRALSPLQSSSQQSSNHGTWSLDIFACLERKFHPKTSQAAILHRRLLFDAVTEILGREQSVNSWKAFAGRVRTPSLRRVWSEVRRTRERVPAEDICEMICGVLGKDMAAEGCDGWGNRSVEMSEAVLDIERLVFKDLVAETIRELAAFCPKWTAAAVAPKRMLVF